MTTQAGTWKRTRVARTALHLEGGFGVLALVKLACTGNRPSTKLTDCSYKKAEGFGACSVTGFSCPCVPLCELARAHTHVRCLQTCRCTRIVCHNADQDFLCVQAWLWQCSPASSDAGLYSKRTRSPSKSKLWQCSRTSGALSTTTRRAKVHDSHTAACLQRLPRRGEDNVQPLLRCRCVCEPCTRLSQLSLRLAESVARPAV